MLLFFGFIALLLLVSGMNNKIPELGQAIQMDVIGTEKRTGFFVWAFALIVIGSLGYVKELRPLSNAFLVLVFIVLILSNRGLFANISKGLNNG